MDLNNLLRKCDIALFTTIVEISINGLCGKAEIIPESTLSEEEFIYLSQATRQAIVLILKHTLNSTQVPSDEWAEVDAKFIEIIHKQLEANAEDKKDIKKLLVLSKNGPRLQNFDWDVKWVLGSSSLSSLEVPLTTLHLKLSDGSTHEIEMNRSEMSRMIEILGQ